MGGTNGNWECRVHGTGVQVIKQMGRLRCAEKLTLTQMPCYEEVYDADRSLAEVYAKPVSGFRRSGDA